jgi:uncharacterized membrane protein YoaK (UPF0700 family)
MKMSLPTWERGLKYRSESIRLGAVLVAPPPWECGLNNVDIVLDNVYNWHRLILTREAGVVVEQSFHKSESARLVAVLAFSGGLMDAYSYVQRGGVFANAQTGNMIRLGLSLSSGDFHAALNYLFPILSFAFGILLADIVCVRKNKLAYLHWRQITVLAEAVILVIVSFIPASFDRLANALTSLACGIQVESFRKIHGYAAATTMCIGNLRSGTENLHRFLLTREEGCLKAALLYYGIIVCFVLGAVFGSAMVECLHQRAILCSSVMLVITFFVMTEESDKTEKSDKTI